MRHQSLARNETIAKQYVSFAHFESLLCGKSVLLLAALGPTRIIVTCFATNEARNILLLLRFKPREIYRPNDSPFEVLRLPRVFARRYQRRRSTGIIAITSMSLSRLIAPSIATVTFGVIVRLSTFQTGDVREINTSAPQRRRDRGSETNAETRLP